MENHDHFFCSGLSDSHVVNLGAKRGSLMSNSTGIAHTFISTLGLSIYSLVHNIQSSILYTFQIQSMTHHSPSLIHGKLQI